MRCTQRRGSPEFSGGMIGWVLRGVSMGSHGYSWVLMGSQWVLMGSQWVLSGFSDCAFLGSQVVLRQAPPPLQVSVVQDPNVIIILQP